MNHLGQVQVGELGGQLPDLASCKNASVATLVTWASIDREASRFTPKLLTVPVSEAHHQELGDGNPNLAHYFYRTSIFQPGLFQPSNHSFQSLGQARWDGV